MKRFHHQFTVNAPIERVVRFHRSSQNLKRISPPWIPMSGLDANDTLQAGDEFAFTLWLGPLPVRWLARIEASGKSGFTDRQINGPFAHWVHRHEFSAISEDITRVDDTVDYLFNPNLSHRLIGGFMAFGLPMLFRYRASRTARLLESEDADRQSAHARIGAVAGGANGEANATESGATLENSG